MNTVYVYHFAGSWSQSLDISVDSQLDISQPRIVSLIHCLPLTFLFKWNNLLSQSNVSAPFYWNFTTAHLHLCHSSFLASVHFNTLSSGWSMSPNSASLCETRLYLLSCPQPVGKCLTPSTITVQKRVILVCVCLSPPFRCASLWFNNLLRFYWRNKLSGVLFIPLLSLPIFLKST